MLRRRGTRKKKQRDQPAADEGFIYESTPSGVGVQTAQEEKDHVTIQALEELVFGGQVSFKHARDSAEEESDDEVPSKYDMTGLQTESAWVDEDDETVRYKLLMSKIED